MTSISDATAVSGNEGKEETRVMFTSSLRTVFEWYDFYLYAIVAPFFATVFLCAQHGRTLAM